LAVEDAAIVGPGAELKRWRWHINRYHIVGDKKAFILSQDRIAAVGDTDKVIEI